MTAIGVMLSGCGVKDGSEIHEAVLTLLFLDRRGAEIVCMAPDIQQQQVINHLTGEKSDEQRNVLVESARIARGEIKDLKQVSADDIDGLILPGGFGAVTNLSDFASKGKDTRINEEVKRLLNEMVSSGKPVGAICIAPATLAGAIRDRSPVVTIGNDMTTSRIIEEIGGRHQNCSVNEIHVDETNKLVTTPAYMLGPGIKDIAVGIEKLVDKIMDMTINT
ncbi:MAG: isoprenoid biosynthesis glyoxalase ElbB [Desulfobacterales bacterium]